MPLKWQNVHVPLAQGVETKADRRALQPPKLLAAENLVFDDVGGLQKRPGHDALSLTTMTGAAIDPQRVRALGVRRDELLLFAQGHVYSYADAPAKWSDRGVFESVHVEQATPAVRPESQIDVDRAEGDTFIGYVWGASVRWQFVDKQTGALVEQGVYRPIDAGVGITSAASPRLRRVGDNFHVYFVDTTGGGAQLKAVVYAPSTIYTGSVVTIATDISSSRNYDVSVDETNDIAYIAYRNTSNQYTLKRVTAAGSVATTSAKARSCKGNLAIAYGQSTGGLVVIRHADKDADGGNDVMADWVTASSLADATVNITVKASETPVDLTAAVFSSSGTKAYALWDTTAAVSGLSGGPGSEISSQRVVKRALLTASALSSVKTLVRDSRLASRAAVWTDDATDRVFAHVVYVNPHPDVNSGSGTLQPQFVLLDCDQVAGDETAGSGTSRPAPIARVLPGEAYSAAGAIGGLMPQLESVGSGVFAWATTSTRVPAQEDAPWTYQALVGLRDVRYTFGDARAYRGAEAGESLYLPGGYLAAYDGRDVHEASFFTFPEGIDAETYNASPNGPLAVSTPYSYQFFWEHRSAKGERIFSSYAGAVTVTTGGSDDAARFVIPICPYTQREGVVLAVFRSEENPEVNAPHYRISDPVSGATHVENDVNGTHVYFEDNDLTPTLTEMLDNEQSPVSLGELDGVPPGASPLVAAGQSRLFTTHPESRTLVSPSLLRFSGEEASFNEDLELSIPDPGGAITGLVALEDAVVVFKERAIYVIAGTGPDNLGQGGYGDAQLVSELVGCLDARTIARIPTAILFKSEQGFYSLNTAYQLEFIGAAVEDYNGRTITAAVAQPHRHRVLFLGAYDAADPYSLSYDYLVGQWSVWTGLCGPSAVSARDIDGTVERATYYVHEAASTTRSIRKEATDHDDAGTNYSVDVETAWIKFEGLQDYSAVRWFEVLGEIRSAGTLRVQVAYNYRDTWVDTAEFTVSGTAGDPLQFRRRFSQRKVAAVKFRITEGPSGVPSAGEVFRLTGISVNVGFKQGLYRLPAAQTG